MREKGRERERGREEGGRRGLSASLTTLLNISVRLSPPTYSKYSKTRGGSRSYCEGLPEDALFILLLGLSLNMGDGGHGLPAATTVVQVANLVQDLHSLLDFAFLMRERKKEEWRDGGMDGGKGGGRGEGWRREGGRKVGGREVGGRGEDMVPLTEYRK